MAYGYVLLLGGPLANLSYNMDAASRSQACGSAMAMNQSSTIFEIVTAPLSGNISLTPFIVQKPYMNTGVWIMMNVDKLDTSRVHGYHFCIVFRNIYLYSLTCILINSFHVLIDYSID